MRESQPRLWAGMRAAGNGVIADAAAAGAGPDELRAARRALAATLNHAMTARVERVARRHFDAVRNTHPAVKTGGDDAPPPQGSVAEASCAAARLVLAKHTAAAAPEAAVAEAAIAAAAAAAAVPAAAAAAAAAAPAFVSRDAADGGGGAAADAGGGPAAAAAAAPAAPAPAPGGAAPRGSALDIKREAHTAASAALARARRQLGKLQAAASPPPGSVDAASTAVAAAAAAEVMAAKRLRRARRAAHIASIALAGSRDVRGVWKRLLNLFNQQREDGAYVADGGGGGDIPAVFPDAPDVPAIDAVARESAQLYAARGGPPLAGPAWYGAAPAAAGGGPAAAVNGGGSAGTAPYRVTCPRTARR